MRKIITKGLNVIAGLSLVGGAVVYLFEVLPPQDWPTRAATLFGTLVGIFCFGSAYFYGFKVVGNREKDLSSQALNSNVFLLIFLSVGAAIVVALEEDVLKIVATYFLFALPSVANIYCLRFNSSLHTDANGAGEF